VCKFRLTWNWTWKCFWIWMKTVKMSTINNDPTKCSGLDFLAHRSLDVCLKSKAVNWFNQAAIKILIGLPLLLLSICCCYCHDLKFHLFTFYKDNKLNSKNMKTTGKLNFSLNETSCWNPLHCKVKQILSSNKNVVFLPIFSFNFMQHRQQVINTISNKRH